MKTLKVLVMFGLGLFVLNSCEESKNEKSKKEDAKEIEKVAEPKIVIDSSSFKVKKTDFKDFKVGKDETPSSKEEVEKLVASEDISALNDYQKFAQEFINASAKKDYNAAAKYLAYNGLEISRINTDSYNYANTSEKGVVKSTADVIFKFLSESSNYKFISSKEKTKDGQKFQELEIAFFKKGLGVNRRYFDVIDTPNGMLIYNMR